MSVMLPGNPVSRTSYILRAVIATALIVAFAIWMVARSTGVLETNPEIHAEVPVEAGLITTGAPVRYHGVKVGEIASIDAGTTSSVVSLTIDDNYLSSIPDTVLMRVLPRTFFGDIYVALIDTPGASRSRSLSDGDEIRIDDGPEAINLYDIFTKLSDVLAEVQPEKMNIALAAVSAAIGTSGGDLGIMIDDWWQTSRELESTMNRFIDATPRFRAVMESLRRATPAITDTLRSTTSISRGIVEHQENLDAFLASASGFVGSVAPFLAQQRRNLITIVDSTATIASTVADNPSGVTDTSPRQANSVRRAPSCSPAAGSTSPRCRPSPSRCTTPPPTAPPTGPCVAASASAPVAPSAPDRSGNPAPATRVCSPPASPDPVSPLQVSPARPSSTVRRRRAP